MTRAARPAAGVPAWGLAVRDARRAAGLTQDDLARATGLSVGAVRDLEQGRTLAPKNASVVAIRDVLGAAVPTFPTTTPGPSAESTVRIGVLGPLRCEIDGHDRTPRGRLQASMLALAAIHVGDLVSNDTFAELLWPRDRPRHVDAALHTHAARLRGLLAGSPPAEADVIRPALVRERGGYRLVAPAGTVDVEVFAGRVRRAMGAADATERVTLLASALALWRGPALADLTDLAGEPEVVVWDQRRRDAASDLAHHALHCDPETASAAADTAAHVLRLHALDEQLATRVMRLLIRLGRPGDALRVFADVRAALARELGAEPGPALQEAHGAALRTGPMVDVSPPPRPPVPSELPRDIPDFVGHAEEIAIARAELVRDDGLPGLVAIVGMGGIGKTTLATRVAHGIRAEFPDGQLHVDLRGTDARPVPTSRAVDLLLRRLDIVSNPADDAAARAALLRTALSRGRYLLVLDDARSAAQVRELLPGSAGSAAVITSRRSLVGLDGVVQIRMRVLPPSVAQAFVRRLVGAEQVDGADERALAGIAEACGYLPLALRLAVDHASAAHPDLQTLHASLTDSSSRWRVLRQGDRAVRASLELGWSALDVDLRRTVGDLASLPGGAVHLDAALAAADLADEEPLLALAELSLVELRAGRRVAMHDLVRAVVRELEPRDSRRADSPTGRAIGWYSARACAMTAAHRPHRPRPSPAVPAAPAAPSATAAPDVTTTEATTPVDAATWRDAEHEFLLVLADAIASDRAPCDWRLLFAVAISCEDKEESARAIAVARAALRRTDPTDREAVAFLELVLGRAYGMSSRYREALAPLIRARRAARDADLPAVEVWTHELAALVHDLRGEQAVAAQHYTAALELAERARLTHLQWTVLNNFGDLDLSRGNVDDAVRRFEQALTLTTALGNRAGQLVSTAGLGSAAWRSGDHSRALELLAPVVPELLELGQRRTATEVLPFLARAAVGLDRRDVAEAAAVRALDLAVRNDDGVLFAGVLTAVAVVEARWGDVGRGVDALTHALAITRALASPATEIEVLLAHDVVTLRRERPELVAAAAAAAHRVAQSIGSAEAAARAVALHVAVHAAPVPRP